MRRSPAQFAGRSIRTTLHISPGIPIENVVVYVAPALLLDCGARALAALGYYAGVAGRCAVVLLANVGICQ